MNFIKRSDLVSVPKINSIGERSKILDRYRYGIYNSRYYVCHSDVTLKKDRTFYCPRQISGHTINGILPSTTYGEEELDSLFYCRFRILFIDCELLDFEIAPKSFDSLKRIILGPHFSASEQIIEKMVNELQNKNPSLYKRFPSVEWWNGKKFDVSKYVKEPPRVFVFKDDGSYKNTTFKIQVSDPKIKCGSIVVVEKNHYSPISGTVIQEDEKFSGFIESLPIVKKVIEY